MHKKIERQSFNPRPRTRRRIEGSEDEETESVEGLTYWDIVIQCMAKFGKQSLEEVNDMTLTEFLCLTHASHERDLYNEYKMHKQAFVAREVEAQKKKLGGKKGETEYVYKEFNDFFDYEKALNDLRNFESSKKEAQEKQERDEVLNMLARNNKKRMNKQ